jgi:hypothetical protein
MIIYFAYFVNKIPTQFGTLIAVENCGQLSHLMSEVLTQLQNKLSTITEPTANAAQSSFELVKSRLKRYVEYVRM